MQTGEVPSEQTSPPDIARTVQEAVQAERERIAKLLHATICQNLTGGYLLVCATALRCRQLAPELEPRLNGIAEKLLTAGEELRRLMHSLQPEEQRKETILDP